VACPRRSAIGATVFQLCGAIFTGSIGKRSGSKLKKSVAPMALRRGQATLSNLQIVVTLSVCKGAPFGDVIKGSLRFREGA